VEPEKRLKRIAVTGPCAAGKSELVAALRALGYDARHVAQEHSYVPDMWQRVCKPDALIYLDVSYEVARARRRTVGRPVDMENQRHRLRHARAHCDLYIHTDSLTIAQVRAVALRFLHQENNP
jgi:deoxyadenosine/deoxycytidine kinase